MQSCLIGCFSSAKRLLMAWSTSQTKGLSTETWLQGTSCWMGNSNARWVQCPSMLNELPFLSTLLHTWKYIRMVLCYSNTIVFDYSFDYSLQIVLGNTKYFTLSLVRVCKALPCRFWGWLPLNRKCQHLENLIVQMSLNHFSGYCDDWGLKVNKTTCSIYTQLHLQGSMCVCL